MKRVLILCAFAAAAAYALDDFTVNRLQAKINERRITGRSYVVEDGVTNTVTHYSQSGVSWTETNVARMVTGTVAVKRYSVLALLDAIADAGKYAEVKATLQAASAPNGMPYWDMFMAAQYFRADDPRLHAGVQLAVQSGLCTAEEAENILSKAED